MKRRVIWYLITLIGLDPTAAPFVVTQVAFDQWGDNGGAMFWVYPPAALLMHLSLWGGLLLALFGLSRAL